MKGKKLKLQRKNKSYSLKDSALYNLSSKKKLANILFIELSDLNNYKSDSNYTIFFSGDEKKKKRLIECPKKKLDRVHTRIASLLCRIKYPDYLHSGIEMRSNISNAEVHKGKHAVFTTDITSFFPSTHRHKVFSFFYRKMRCASDVADILSHICTFNEHVPTGSRISMPLAFWANYDLFESLQAFSNKKSITMTLYVDDLTFSGPRVDFMFAYNVKKIISRFGHRAHPDKSKLYAGDENKLITGVIVNEMGVKVRNKLLKNIHHDFKLWKKFRERENVVGNSIVPKLLGRLNAASNIDPRFKDKVRSFKKICSY